MKIRKKSHVTGISREVHEIVTLGPYFLGHAEPGFSYLPVKQCKTALVQFSAPSKALYPEGSDEISYVQKTLK